MTGIVSNPSKTKPVTKSKNKPTQAEAGSGSAAALKFVIDQPDLARVLGTVIRAIDNRPLLPILSHMKLEAKDDRLEVTASSIGITIQTHAVCQVEVPGVFALPAQDLNAFVSALDKRSPVSVEVVGTGAAIRSGKSSLTLRGISAAEFPPLPVLNRPQVIEVEAVRFCKAIRSAAYAAGLVEDRPMLQGVTLTFEPQKLTLMASNSFRFSLSSLDAETKVEAETNLNVPAEYLREVDRLFGTLSGSIRLTVGVGDRGVQRVQFEAGEMLVSTQLLSDIYWGSKNPTEARSKFEATMASTTMNVTVNRLLLMAALRRARIVAQDSLNFVRLKFGEETGIEIFAQSKERGETYDQIDAEVEVKSVSFEDGHQLLYLLEALDALPDAENVRLRAKQVGFPLLVEDPLLPGSFAGLSPMQQQA